MKVGLMFANVGAASDPACLSRIAIAAEQIGVESLWAVEHVVIPVDYASRYPYSRAGALPGSEDSPIPDPLLALAYCAAVTSRIRLATGVLIVPLHHPATVAKQVATLDQLSSGRAILGVGIGWLREEMRALGVDPRERAPRCEEGIAAMRALWQPEPRPFAGRFYAFDPVFCRPLPHQPGGVPIVIGGHSEASASRAARLGDGYFPYTDDLARVEQLIGVVRQACLRDGRDPRSVELTCPAPAGSVDAAVEHAQHLAALGVARMTWSALHTDPDELLRSLDRMAPCIEKLAQCTAA